MRLLPSMALVLLTACGDTEPTECKASGNSKGSVVTFATLGRQIDEDKGITGGIDIDGRTSTNAHENGCYVNDFVSPDGRGGIDNQLATLLPLVEEFVGTENLDAILEGAIANGQLLLVFNVEGIDDTQNDDCVDVSFGTGSGTPFLDAEGGYIAYQTFGFDTDGAPVGRLPNSRIENGVLHAGPGDVALPIKILDADFTINLKNARFRFEIDEDPLSGGIAFNGFGGGGIEVLEVQDIVTGLTVGSDFMGAIVPLLEGVADLGESCSQISAALRLETTPAFVDESF